MRQSHNNANKRTAEKSAEDLTTIRESLAEILKRLAALELRVNQLDVFGPMIGDSDEFAAERLRRGPKPKIGDVELMYRRDAYVIGLEQIWPKMALALFTSKTAEQLRVVVAEFAPQMPIRQALQDQFVACSTALFEFLDSERFRIKPSKSAVRLVLNWRADRKCYRAAGTLPPRQIANALAGLPELMWRRSLDRCVADPCELHVRLPTEQYYKRMFGIS